MNCNRSLVPLARQIKLVLEPQRRNFFFRHHYPHYRWGFVDLSKQMEDMERTFARMEREMNATFRSKCPAGFQKGQQQSIFEPSSKFFEKVIEGETVAENNDGGKKYVVKIDLGKKFNPENAKVSLKDRVLTIEAKFEHKSEDGKSRMYQELCKSFTLPENVKMEQVKSLFTPEGELIIEAPLPKVVDAPKSKEIPITMSK